MKGYGRVAPLRHPWKCDVSSRLCPACLAAAILATAGLPAAADVTSLYRVDQAGIGSCYDADLSLMLPAHVFAYLQAGTLEVSIPHPPAGITSRERVLLLGDLTDPFPAEASRYLVKEVPGKGRPPGFRFNDAERTRRAPCVRLPAERGDLRQFRIGSKRVGARGFSGGRIPVSIRVRNVREAGQRQAQGDLASAGGDWSGAVKWETSRAEKTLARPSG